jgi:hypothetical protein
MGWNLALVPWLCWHPPGNRRIMEAEATARNGANAVQVGEEWQA